MKESISFKYEPRPVETQCSDGLATTEMNNDAPLINSLSAIEQSEKEQEEITQSDKVLFSSNSSFNKLQIEGNAISNKTEPQKHPSIKKL